MKLVEMKSIFKQSALDSRSDENQHCSHNFAYVYIFNTFSFFPSSSPFHLNDDGLAKEMKCLWMFKQSSGIIDAVDVCGERVVWMCEMNYTMPLKSAIS